MTLSSIVLGIILSKIASPSRKKWISSISQRSIAFLLSRIFLWINKKKAFLKKDVLSSPLIILRFWLIPVSLMARVRHLQKKSDSKTRLFIVLVLIILLALVITFSSKDLLLFFIGFETTLIPTLLLITRWGMQQERIEAGYYFVFYTLIRSLPLLLRIMILKKKEGHLSFNLFELRPIRKEKIILTTLCLLAFLVKVPIFGLHLWLPKAHVEAPVAGSMILAAILLKMGGYGFIRLTSIFINQFQEKISVFLVPFCCWGGALTRIICITQTDLKSLIAYSSVSHMRFMIAGLSAYRGWAISGGILVMVAHGLVSSALFCIANLFYERTGTRNLSIRRGVKTMVVILPSLWLLFAAAKMGLPPLPKSIGELLTFSAIVTKNISNIFPLALGVIFTGIFRLIIFQQLKTGAKFKWKLIKDHFKEREYCTLILHLLPLFSIVLKPKISTL